MARVRELLGVLNYLNMNKNIIYGLVLIILAQLISYFIYQGQFLSPRMKNNVWISVVIGIPATILTVYSVRYMVEGFGGLMWPSRVISFSIGVILFTILSYIFFKEVPELKTLITLLLATAIICIQILWK
jgi:H+/Cl- antiporter ClcA